MPSLTTRKKKRKKNPPPADTLWARRKSVCKHEQERERENEKTSKATAMFSVPCQRPSIPRERERERERAVKLSRQRAVLEEGGGEGTHLVSTAQRGL